MFQSVLSVQWKWSRVSVLLLAAAAIALAFTSIDAPVQALEEDYRSPLLTRMEFFSTWFRFLAIAGGFLLAMHAWRTDHAVKHVYALSLPVPRWRFVLYRYTSGVLFGCVIVIALWAALALAAATATVPPGLHTYPTGLALRVGLAMLAAYAVFFPLWSGTPRAGYYTAGILVVFVILEILSNTVRPIDAAMVFLFKAVGLTQIYSGRWYLIDV